MKKKARKEPEVRDDENYVEYDRQGKVVRGLPQVGGRWRGVRERRFRSRSTRKTCFRGTTPACGGRGIIGRRRSGAMRAVISA